MSEMPEKIHAWVGPTGNREWWAQQYEEKTYGAFYVRADLVAKMSDNMDSARKLNHKMQDIIDEKEDEIERLKAELKRREK